MSNQSQQSFGGRGQESVQKLLGPEEAGHSAKPPSKPSIVCLRTRSSWDSRPGHAGPALITEFGIFGDPDTWQQTQLPLQDGETLIMIRPGLLKTMLRHPKVDQCSIRQLSVERENSNTWETLRLEENGLAYDVGKSSQLNSWSGGSIAPYRRVSSGKNYVDGTDVKELFAAIRTGHRQATGLSESALAKAFINSGFLKFFLPDKTIAALRNEGGLQSTEPRLRYPLKDYFPVDEIPHQSASTSLESVFSGLRVGSPPRTVGLKPVSSHTPHDPPRSATRDPSESTDTGVHPAIHWTDIPTILSGYSPSAASKPRSGNLALSEQPIGSRPYDTQPSGLTRFSHSLPPASYGPNAQQSAYMESMSSEAGHKRKPPAAPERGSPS